MSLTRKEWNDMWQSVNKIEDAYHENYPPPHSGYRNAVRDAIIDIKAKIESVVGQLETDPRRLQKRT